MLVGILLLGCRESSAPAPQADKDFKLEAIDVAKLGWDLPEERYRIGCNFVIVKLSKDVETDQPCIVALRTLCSKDGLCLPVLYLEKILHCPGCGSDFDFHGIRVRGPAPEDLMRYKISRDGTDGKLRVGLRVTFRREGGGWKKPEARIPAE
jgi:hypothetical protein